jgi:hypothetical protein
MFDVENRTMTLTRAEDNVMDEEERKKRDAKRKKLEAPIKKMTEAQESAKKYLSRMTYNADVALNLFDLIYPFLPEENFNGKDLTVQMFKEGKREVVSVIDYIHALVDENDIDPDPSILKFHKYLRFKRRMHLPKTYILNRIFWI